LYTKNIEFFSKTWKDATPKILLQLKLIYLFLVHV